MVRYLAKIKNNLLLYFTTICCGLFVGMLFWWLWDEDLFLPSLIGSLFVAFMVGKNKKAQQPKTPKR